MPVRVKLLRLLNRFPVLEVFYWLREEADKDDLDT